MPLVMPKKVPTSGFYYHYKHDPNGPVENYAYEVVGVGFHTETNCRRDDKHFVVYRPLYKSSVYRASRELGVPCFDTRPLVMWMSNVEKDGRIFRRFEKIMDQKVISQLEKIKIEMYG